MVQKRTGSNQALWSGAVWDSVGSFIGSNAYYSSSFNYIPNYTAASGIEFRESGNIEFFADSGLTSGVSYNPSERMVITNTGNVGIGTTTPGTHKLHVVGTAGLTTGTAWTNTSDQRWKNVQNELKGSSLDKILALRPVSYKWNDLHDSQFGEDPGLNYGFIAQEVKKVIPEMTSQDDNGYYWYNPSGMEAILTAAIQEQQKQLEDLKAELEGLKAQLNLEQ